LDDIIINAFFTLLPGIAKDIKLLCFDTHFCESILTRESVSMRYNKWVIRNAVWNYPVWLIPVNFAVHWTLLVVVHSRHSIVYLDLHGNPEEKILNGICNFMQQLYGMNGHYTSHVPSQIVNNNIEMETAEYTYAHGHI